MNTVIGKQETINWQQRRKNKDLRQLKRVKPKQFVIYITCELMNAEKERTTLANHNKNKISFSLISYGGIFIQIIFLEYVVSIHNREKVAKVHKLLCSIRNINSCIEPFTYPPPYPLVAL